MVALDSAIGLEDELRVPVKLRASLINGCVYCLNLQSKEGLDARERRERLFGFAARGASSPTSASGNGPRSPSPTRSPSSPTGTSPDDVWDEARRRIPPGDLAAPLGFRPRRVRERRTRVVYSGGGGAGGVY